MESDHTMESAVEDERSMETPGLVTMVEAISQEAFPDLEPGKSSSNSIITEACITEAAEALKLLPLPATEPLIPTTAGGEGGPTPQEEILGSVTTTFGTAEDPESGHTLRTSARVKHKMRMDSIRCSNPASAAASASERKDQAKLTVTAALPKTPGQQKRMRVIWSNHDKNLFFEALNEYGKDFEAIQNYLNSKKRRKESSEQTFKAKDVRNLYYKINQMVSKYMTFSDEIKREAQELYALINYGEMRKKVPFQNKKYLHKLKDLVCKGFTTVREKGKNIRIKTPSCRALRKLNQLEEWQEEIKLPPRVDVLLKPLTMEAWAHVQSLAQNPCVKITVTIQKRLSALLQLFQHKWRSQHQRLEERVEEMKKTAGSISSKIPRQRLLNDVYFCSQIAAAVGVEGGTAMPNALLHFMPLQTAIIHRPMISLVEFQSNTSICLNSYEQRIGVSVRSETLCSDKMTTSCKDRLQMNVKRLRTECGGSEKLTPENGKKFKPCEGAIGGGGGSKDIKEEKHQPSEPSVLQQSCGLQFGEMFKSSSESIELKEMECFDDMKNIFSETTNFVLKSTFSCEMRRGSTQTGDFLNLHSDTSSDGFAPIESDTKGQTDNGNYSTGEEAGSASKPSAIKKKWQTSKRKCSKENALINQFRPLVSEEEIRKIRDGWTLTNVGDLTVGDLYLIFGEDMKLYLEYDWLVDEMAPPRSGGGVEPPSSTDPAVMDGNDGCLAVLNAECDKLEPILPCKSNTDEMTSGNEVEKEDARRKICASNSSTSVSGRLKQLMALVNLRDRNYKKKCVCGTGVERKLKRGENDTDPLTVQCDNCALFKQPLLPVRNTSSNVLSNLPVPSQVRYKQKRWWRSRVNHQHTPQQLQPPPGPVVTFAKANPVAGGSSPSQQQSPQLLKPLLFGGKGEILTHQATTMQSLETNTAQRRSNTGEEGTAEEGTASIRANPASSNEITESAISSRLSANNVRRASVDSCISLFDISLPSTSSSLMNIFSSESDLSPAAGGGEGDLLPEASSTDGGRGKLLDSDMTDISLSSVFGLLGASSYPSGQSPSTQPNDSDMAISVLGESSIDYIAHFEEIAAELRAQQNT
ncbi:protein cramped-like [Anopheles albimanus]|uniref:protein cramped-like n=1 Tax=Anopheles albimanus TaxID=7167 RepID=UPI00163F7775|nr:protein cramped-like [Anopheles albimanus]